MRPSPMSLSLQTPPFKVKMTKNHGNSLSTCKEESTHHDFGKLPKENRVCNLKNRCLREFRFGERLLLNDAQRHLPHFGSLTASTTTPTISDPKHLSRLQKLDRGRKKGWDTLDGSLDRDLDGCLLRVSHIHLDNVHGAAIDHCLGNFGQDDDQQERDKDGQENHCRYEAEQPELATTVKGLLVRLDRTLVFVALEGFMVVAVCILTASFFF